MKERGVEKRVAAPPGKGCLVVIPSGILASTAGVDKDYAFVFWQPIDGVWHQFQHIRKGNKIYFYMAGEEGVGITREVNSEGGIATLPGETSVCI